MTTRRAGPRASRPGATIALTILALTTITSCSARSPRAELARSIKDVRSWAAGACLVADRWRQRSVPTHYALDALEDADKGLRQEASRIGKQEEVEPAVKQQAEQAALRVLRLCVDLRQSIEQRNGAGVAAACREMSGLRDTLGQLASKEAAAAR